MLITSKLLILKLCIYFYNSLKCDISDLVNKHKIFFWEIFPV